MNAITPIFGRFPVSDPSAVSRVSRTSDPVRTVRAAGCAVPHGGAARASATADATVRSDEPYPANRDRTGPTIRLV